MKWTPDLERRLEEVAAGRSLARLSRGGWKYAGLEMLAAIDEIRRLRAQLGPLQEMSDALMTAEWCHLYGEGLHDVLLLPRPHERELTGYRLHVTLATAPAIWPKKENRHAKP